MSSVSRAIINLKHSGPGNLQKVPPKFSTLMSFFVKLFYTFQILLVKIKVNLKQNFFTPI